MALFGLGAALPLLLSVLSREALMRWRGRMSMPGRGLKIALGALLVCGGILILTAPDHRLEASLVDASPVQLTGRTTQF